jgi:hypothetical protein
MISIESSKRKKCASKIAARSLAQAGARIVARHSRR